MSKDIHIYETKMEGGKKKAETERLSIIAFKEQKKVSFNLVCIKGPLFQFPSWVFVRVGTHGFVVSS